MALLTEFSSKKGVLFDFDDTLAKTKFGKIFGLKSASLRLHDHLRKKGVAISFAALYKKVQRITKEIECKRMYKRNFWWLSIIQEFLKEPPQRAFLDDVTAVYWNAVEKKSEPYKDALPLLAYLKKKKYVLGMVSDTDGVGGMKSRRIKNLHFQGWFDTVVVAGEDTRQTKPDRAPFLLALKRLRMQAKQCVFVGNNPFVDILGAQKAGMTTVLIERDNCKTRIKPDRLLHTLGELQRIL